jgi:hypothetical protein
VLERAWSGREIADPDRNYITVTFKKGGGGTLEYTSRGSLGMPLQSVERQGKNGVRFSVQMRGAVRYYAGEWDGRRIVGTIGARPDGKGGMGTFELQPR